MATCTRIQRPRQVPKRLIIYWETARLLPARFHLQGRFRRAALASVRDPLSTRAPPAVLVHSPSTMQFITDHTRLQMPGEAGHPRSLRHRAKVRSIPNRALRALQQILCSSNRSLQCHVLARPTLSTLLHPSTPTPFPSLADPVRRLHGLLRWFSTA